MNVLNNVSSVSLLWGERISKNVKYSVDPPIKDTLIKGHDTL